VVAGAYKADMKIWMGAVRHSIFAAAVLVAASQGAEAAPVVTTTTTTTEVATVSSSTTSSTWVPGGIGECEFDLVVADAAAFESLSLTVRGILSNTRCSLASISELEGADLAGSAFHGLQISKVSQSLPAGTVLLRCDSDEFIEWKQTVDVDFLDVEASVTSATGTDGSAVSEPRVCATAISCSYYGGGDLEWSGEPMCGDANYDSWIRATDALRALFTSVGQPSCFPVSSVCDANGDTEVTATDALLILRASIQSDMILECPVPCHP
jgi:hypothetical protein